MIRHHNTIGAQPHGIARIVGIEIPLMINFPCQLSRIHSRSCRAMDGSKLLLMNPI